MATNTRDAAALESFSRKRGTRPIIEADGLAKLLEWGRTLDLSKHMYGNYEAFQKLLNEEPYRQLHDSLEQVETASVPELVEELARRPEIRTLHSIGPSPSVDKFRLEGLVNRGKEIVYSPVDVSPEAIRDSLSEVRAHLDSRFGGSWKKKVALSDNGPRDLASVISNEPSCVILDGGTIMNRRNLWSQAAELANVGGLVAASAALTPSQDEKDFSDYWMRFYGTPATKELFEELLRSALPELSLEAGRGTCDVDFEYVASPKFFNPLEDYCTPRISAQLKVKRPMSIDLNGEKITSLPTRTWAEQHDWEDPHSDFRRRFDNDPAIRKAIENAYSALDSGANFNQFMERLPPECRKMPPIELAMSAKHHPVSFFYVIPSRFGMKMEAGFKTGIDYAQDGRQGMAASAIFSVEKPNAERIFFKERAQTRLIPPGYPHDPTLPS